MSNGRRLNSVAPLAGRDLALDYALAGGYFEEADLASGPPAATAPGAAAGRRDLLAAEGLDNLTQAIANRLKTRRGELAALGHPEYGSRHHELIGQPNVERTRNLVKLYVLQALRDEPRIERVVAATVAAEHAPPRESVRIEVTVLLAASPQPLDLVVPFSFGGAP